MITCYLRYRIDMHQVSEFEEYARMWIPLVERFGGTHHGYFLPHESDSDLAVALFSFPSLADYEQYRTKSAKDADCRAAYEFAEKTRCIIRYERHFLRPVCSETAVDETTETETESP
jgi:uncharacterized protein (DUF1330 family)